MKSLLSRRQARKVERAFSTYSRRADETRTAIAEMMRELRVTGAGWLEAIEELERTNPTEAARLPAPAVG